MHLASFLFGIVVTLVAGYFYILALAFGEPKTSRHKRMSEEDQQKMIKSIKIRFGKVEKITIEQMRLMDLLTAPNKGAAHAKGKKDLVDGIEALEDNKINIFRSILKDGFNPVVSMYNEAGKKEDMKMSEAIERSENFRNKGKKPFKPKTNMHLIPPPPLTPVTRLRPKNKKSDLKNVSDNVFKLSDFRSKNEPDPTKTR